MKKDCVREPVAFKDKEIGNSKYYFETFEDSGCN